MLARQSQPVDPRFLERQILRNGQREGADMNLIPTVRVKAHGSLDYFFEFLEFFLTARHESFRLGSILRLSHFIGSVNGRSDGKPLDCPGRLRHMSRDLIDLKVDDLVFFLGRRPSIGTALHGNSALICVFQTDFGPIPFASVRRFSPSLFTPHYAAVGVKFFFADIDLIHINICAYPNNRLALADDTLQHALYLLSDAGLGLTLVIELVAADKCGLISLVGAFKQYPA